MWPHLLMTNHMVGVGVKLVTSAMVEACEWATQKFKASGGELLKKLEAAGMKVVTPDAAAIREKAKPAVNGLFKTAWSVNTWEEVLAQ